MSSWDWLISLSITSSRFIHVTGCVRISSLFKALSISYGRYILIVCIKIDNIWIVGVLGFYLIPWIQQAKYFWYLNSVSGQLYETVWMEYLLLFLLILLLESPLVRKIECSFIQPASVLRAVCARHRGVRPRLSSGSLQSGTQARTCANAEREAGTFCVPPKEEKRLRSSEHN